MTALMCGLLGVCVCTHVASRVELVFFHATSVDCARVNWTPRLFWDWFYTQCVAPGHPYFWWGWASLLLLSDLLFSSPAVLDTCVCLHFSCLTSGFRRPGQAFARQGIVCRGFHRLPPGLYMMFLLLVMCW